MGSSTATARDANLLRRCGTITTGLSADEIRRRANRIRRAVRAETGPAPRAERSRAWDAHVAAEFRAHDLAATMRTMIRDPHVLHVPTLEGGRGGRGVRRYYATRFLPRLPGDLRLRPISRTIDDHRLVDEFVMEFTHDRPLDFIFPGLPPTGRRVALPTVAIVGMRGDRLASEHIYWDQASALAQIGRLPRRGLPIFGAEEARRLTDYASG